MSEVFLSPPSSLGNSLWVASVTSAPQSVTAARRARDHKGCEGMDFCCDTYPRHGARSM